MIDLRSDTVTRPTPAMLAAMVAARVGDDVFGEDPTINELEARTADYFGKDAAIFVPSGTMANQIAIRLHCRPGDELLTEETNHIVLWEAGGPAALSGVTVRPIIGRHGILNPIQLEGMVRPDDIHAVRTRLVCLENTHNRGGGTIYPLEYVRGIADWARRHGLAMHLDGARIANAIVATGVGPREWAKCFDTVSICFSKGLGAPVGSALVGPKDLIQQARRVRKLFGGGMRQAGILAAAGLYALENNVARLAEDHANAKLIAAAIADTPGLTLTPATVESNLIWFEAETRLGSAREIAAKLREKGVLVAALGEQTLRAVTHLDVTRNQCKQAAEAIRGLS